MQASKLAADWSMRWSRDTLLKKLQLYGSVALLMQYWLSKLRFSTYNEEQLARSFWLNFSLIGSLEKGCEVTPSFL